METPGTLIDKLITVDLKMWNNQEALYTIRRQTFIEFQRDYIAPDGGKNLYEILKKACDLNVQRNSLMYELDNKFSEILNKAANGEQQSIGFDPHKTY